MEKLKISVVIKKNKKWIAGYLSNGIFTENLEVKKLADIKEHTDYITLKKFLKNLQMDDEYDKILEKLDCESVYVLEKPINPSGEEFENYWWSQINDLCKDCIKLCKQSNKVIIEKCPSYKLGG